MCGITGYFSLDQNRRQALQDALPAMTQQLYNRGPDHQQQWYSAGGDCGLGHARLSILDLSDNGSQPMLSPSGRYAMVFNGEIYNFQEIRRQLEQQGAHFRGSSDSEVLVTAIEYYGIEETLQRIIGMFAFAIWDDKTRQLFLARDRTGEKPLYYGIDNGTLLFTSDLNVFRRCPGVDLSLDPEALGLFFSHNYIPAPYSIFKGIRKLLPGHYLHIAAEGDKLQADQHQYWSVRQPVRADLAADASAEQLLDRTEELLTDAVDKQMVSDVPLGALLSGGIDSSTIVALMQSLSATPVNTFTIGFNEKAFDESGFAEQIAQHLGTHHHCLILEPKDVMDVIPRLSDIYSEPFADSSQLPTFLVSQMARKHVTVALSGDGGDELFAGYDRYHQTLAAFSGKPTATAAAAAHGSTGLARHLKHWDRILDPLITGLRRYPTSLSSTRFYRRWQQKSADSLQAFYRHRIEVWPYGFLQHSMPGIPHYALNNPLAVASDEQPLRALQQLDMLSYLPDDILCKVDRAAMANSLETRAPLLDHRLVELSQSMPEELLVRDNKAKWPLRNILYKHVPQALIERPKMGFAIPIGEWIRGPLRGWSEELLSEQALRQHDLLDNDYIAHAWQRHLNGGVDLSTFLWGILMFQQWYQSWRDYLK